MFPFPQTMHLACTPKISQVSLALLMMLVGCGRVEHIPADQVHAQYVAALQANDREGALALTVDRGDLQALQAASVDQQLLRMHAEMQGTTGAFPTGPLVRVEILPMETKGQDQVGRSRWVYPQRTICHQAVLQQTPGGWRVTGWYDSLNCEL